MNEITFSSSIRMRRVHWINCTFLTFEAKETEGERNCQHDAILLQRIHTTTAMNSATFLVKTIEY